MTILPPGPDSKPWTSEIRDAAREAVRIAADQHRAICAGADRTLAYYLRSALAHGLTAAEVCQAGDLDPLVVRDLTDPAAI